MTPNLVKSAFSLLRRLRTWHCPHLLLSAVQQSIFCPPGPQQQTRNRVCRCCCCALGTDRRTGKRTDLRPMHRPCSVNYAGSANEAYTYHGLRGSASLVLTATGFVNGRWQFSTPTESTPLDRSPKNLVEVITSATARLCQIWCKSVDGGLLGKWVKYNEKNFLFIPFFS